MISLHRALRLKSSLQSTVLSPEYLEKEYDDDGVKGIILNEFFWKKAYLIVRMFFPLLKLLRSVDSNTPSMSSIIIATLKVESGFDKSEDDMISAFDPDIEVGRETVFGSCKDAYFYYAEKLKHAYALVGFVVKPNCLHDFRSFDDEGKLVDACEFVVGKIYYGDDDLDARMSEFHASLTDYKWKRGTISRGYIWNDSKLEVAGRIHEWHESYSVPHHSTFGEVAMIVSAQLAVPGGAERDWQKVKHVSDGRELLDSDNLEKAVKVYEGHRREMALVTEEPGDMPLHRFWTEEEMGFDLGLEKFGVNIDMTADNTVTFNNFIEEWEENAIKHKKK